MKKHLLTFLLAVVLLLCLGAAAYADGFVAIDAAHFPDEAFREYVGATFDKNSDGVLDPDEIIRAEHVMLSSDHAWVENGSMTQEEFNYITTHYQNRVASLEGIQYLTHLRWLSAINITLLTGDLDLSYNTALETVNLKTSQPNKSLTGLTLGNLPKLTMLNVANHDSLGSVDVSGCPALETLSAPNTALRELDVSENPQLRELHINDNLLSSLDLTRNPLLEMLSCVNNPQLTALDVSHNPNLVCLWLALDSGLSRLTLGYQQALRILTVQNTALTELDISGCPILLELITHQEYYKDMDTRHLYETGTTNDDERLAYNKTTTLKTDGSVAIDAAHFPDEAFRQYLRDKWDGNGDGILSAEEIDAVEMIVVCSYDPWVGEGFLTQAEADYIRDNLHDKLTSLKGIEYFTNLKHLFAFGMPNLAGTIDLRQNTMLRGIDIRDNAKVTDVLFGTSYPFMFELRCGRIGGISSGLDLSAFPALEELSIDQLHLGTLDLSHNVHLKSLQCPSNDLTELDLSHNTELVFVGCNHNRLTSLDLSHNPDLESLNVFNNNLTELDLSHTPKLRQLSAQYNRMSVLDISPCQKLLDLLTHPEYYQERGDCHLYQTGKGNMDDRLFYHKATLLKTSADQSFTFLTLPDSLTEIGAEAFAGIAADIVIVPASCATIAERAFANSARLKVFSVAANTELADNVFEGSENVYVLKRPEN